MAGEQSNRNWGWCRQQNRDVRELALAHCHEDVGRPERGTRRRDRFPPQRAGLRYDHPERLDRWERWGSMARPLGVDTRMLTGAEISALLPGNDRIWRGGVHSPDDGRAEPELAVPAIAKGARRLRATILQNCAARELETQDSRICGVDTEKGLIRCSSVLVAGGAWSGMFLRHHRLRFLQASVKSTAFYTIPAKAVAEGGVAMESVTIRRRLDGGYTIGLTGQGQLQISPWGMLQARDFWRTFQTRRKGLTFGIGGQFFKGPEAIRRWNAEGISPFEEVRTLDPVPDQNLVERGISRLVAAYPNSRAFAPPRAGLAWWIRRRMPFRLFPVFGHVQAFHLVGCQRPRLRHRPGGRKTGCRPDLGRQTFASIRHLSDTNA
ncbi:NAD(P)/FAD-dependent oxidoreductase [Rhizobium tubonense]|uniref:NAD(P)/FAD-dependent oxidoreductase n=1 Tax=Rhizobium tubonense TaxID=484088 RepID=UPI0023B9FF94|nr:FAD-dependent oxidoreductase [Rhizobium tubonense]